MIAIEFDINRRDRFVGGKESLYLRAVVFVSRSASFRGQQSEATHDARYARPSLQDSFSVQLQFKVGL